MVGPMNAFTILGKRLKPTSLFGPSLSVHRDDYFTVHGHESVKDKILEGKIYIFKIIPSYKPCSERIGFSRELALKYLKTKIFDERSKRSC
jgi:hypothetical protein